jgi:TorA maturation chaperone TorD
MDLFRVLGVLCEPPTPSHHALAATLNLPGEPRNEDYADIFLFQLYPYASVYLGADGKLGGEARDRVAGFWRALGLTPPAEPDHLAALLGLYAGLAEHRAPPEWRRALLWEHLLSWTPPYLAKLDQIASPVYRAWGWQLREVLAVEATTLGPVPTEPLAHRQAPLLEPPAKIGGAAFIDQLLVPVRTGFVLVRADLVAAGRELGLGLRVAERRYILEALLSQDAGAILRWLSRYARASAEHQGQAFWRGRATAAAVLLEQAAMEAEGTATAGDRLGRDPVV